MFAIFEGFNYWGERLLAFRERRQSRPRQPKRKQLRIAKQKVCDDVMELFLFTPSWTQAAMAGIWSIDLGLVRDQFWDFEFKGFIEASVMQMVLDDMDVIYVVTTEGLEEFTKKRGLTPARR